MQPLLDKCINAHELVLAELRRVRHIPESRWPFARGHTVRTLPAYLSRIFSKYPRAEQVRLAFPKGHKAENCAIAAEIPTPFKRWDEWLFGREVAGWVNWPTEERASRKNIGLETAFENAWQTSDWLKPREGTQGRKDWISKVDWKLARRVDPELKDRDSNSFKLESMDREVRGELEHDALVMRAVERMNEIEGNAPDSLNPS